MFNFFKIRYKYKGARRSLADWLYSCLVEEIFPFPVADFDGIFHKFHRCLLPNASKVIFSSLNCNNEHKVSFLFPLNTT